MNFHETMANCANARYEEMIREGLAYFTPANPTKELEEALSKTITELSNLVCSLIARYVLYCDVTRRGRRQRLSSMGFDATHPIPDLWSGPMGCNNTCSSNTEHRYDGFDAGSEASGSP